nr:zoocin A [Streptococcus anginosus]
NKLKVYQVNDLQFVNGIWQVRCNYLVPVEFDWTQNGIACEDIDITDANSNVISDQETKVGSFFVINPNKVVSDGEGAYGSGGYYWRHVTLAASGRVWLSV